MIAKGKTFLAYMLVCHFLLTKSSESVTWAMTSIASWMKTYKLLDFEVYLDGIKYPCEQSPWGWGGGLWNIYPFKIQSILYICIILGGTIPIHDMYFVNQTLIR